MDYIIEGQHKLNGEVAVCGSKNCALPLLAATVLTDKEVVLHNCPDIFDVQNMLSLLESLGKKTQRQGETVIVGGEVATTQISREKAVLLRGSGLLLGGLVAKRGSAFLPQTGGCAIGKRPMDIHVDGLRALGVEVDDAEGIVCHGKPVGGKYRLRMPSVGATENLLCAASLCKQTTVLLNCAMEPEVVALQRFLQLLGVKIQGVGTSTLHIEGKESLGGGEFQIIPDRIVACTYLACAVACGGNVTVKDCSPMHFECFLKMLEERFTLRTFQNAVNIVVSRKTDGYGSVTTAPYPGFPTDVQQILLSLAALSDGGTTKITETLFENRLKHNVSQLQKMGAEVSCRGDCAEIRGKNLHAADVSAADLRGGAALVVAALGAEGTSRVSQAQHIFRGYSCFRENLVSLGGKMEYLQ